MYKHVERMKQRVEKKGKEYKECTPNEYQSTIANKTKENVCCMWNVKTDGINVECDEG